MRNAQVKPKVGKYRLCLRAALVAGNIIALFLLIQDASRSNQSVVISAHDDDKPKAVSDAASSDQEYRPQSRLAEMDKKRKQKQIRRQRQQKEQRRPVQRQRQQSDSDSLAHYMPGLKNEPKHPMLKPIRPTKLVGHVETDDAGPPLNPPNFTHYFIHIPKAGGTYARHQINKDMRAQQLVRKKGILCDRGVSPVSKHPTWPTHYEYKARVRTKRNNVDGDERTGKPPEKQVVRKHKCGMYMTESHWSPTPEHVYTIVRDPYEHIVSAFFHCKESKHHGKRHGHLMPETLEEWLQIWVDVKKKRGIAQAKAVKDAAALRCYNPINIQSTLLLTAPGPDEKNEITKERLAKRYDVVGLTSQMSKSLCLVLIHWNGFAPERCICKEGEKKRQQDDSDGENSADDESKGQQLAHLGAIHAHNVTNHGSTHNHTQEELLAIEQLADADIKLYAVAKELFSEQVAKAERRLSKALGYSAHLC